MDMPSRDNKDPCGQQATQDLQPGRSWKKVVSSWRLAPQLTGTDKALWFPKFSPTSAAAPRATWLKDWLISANQAGHQLRGSH